MGPGSSPASATRWPTYRTEPRHDDRHRQHRRRHLDVRTADLPRPRHGDVHPRRRHRRRARLGPADETWNAKEELAAYGVEPSWFGLGDRDLATHLVRTQMLGAGYPLSDVTAALCARWQPGVRLLPMTDDRVETHVVIDDARRRRRTARRPLPGVLGAAARAAGTCGHPGRGGGLQARTRRPRGHRRRRPRDRAAVQPGRVGRDDPRRAGHRRRRAHDSRCRRRRRLRSSAGHPSAAWPTSFCL